MNRAFAKKILPTTLLLVLGITWGCGTSEYERRLDDRINSLKTGSKFNVLKPAKTLPGTRVSIRVPDAFKEPLQEGAKKVDERRIKPNVIDFPSLVATYEGYIEDANKGKYPYYLYVGVSTDARRDNFPRNLQGELAGKFSDTSTLNEHYKADTPEGRTVEWKQCRGTGNQEFYYVNANGDGKFQPMNGVMELLFLEENDALVILGWRLPTSIEQSLDFKSWINMVAGCVKVAPK
jgi:hypothetical protein